jgi:hypothetical protein
LHLPEINMNEEVVFNPDELIEEEKGENDKT